MGHQKNRKAFINIYYTFYRFTVNKSCSCYLIEKTVDPEKADYAVITGIQIHSTRVANSKVWHPHLEFIAPTSMYIVKDGIKHTMDIMGIDPPTPRQLFKIGAGEYIYELPKPRGSGWF